MRVPTVLFALTILAPAAAASAASIETGKNPAAATASECRKTSSYLADRTGSYQGRPLTPKKLTELPPATAYMAVYRHIGPCEAPLTMVDYRNPRRR